MITVTVSRNGNCKVHTYKRQSRHIFNRVTQTINADITVTLHTKWGDIVKTKAEYIQDWIAEQELIEASKGR